MILFKIGLFITGLVLGLGAVIILEYVTYRISDVASFLVTLLCMVTIPNIALAFTIEVDYHNILCFMVTGELLGFVLGVGYFFAIQTLLICGRIYDFIHK